MTETPSISHKPLSLLFNPGTVDKRTVWDIDLLYLLELVARILERKGRKDLRMAGIAALSSSMIYRMKVDSIFALQEAAARREPPSKSGRVAVQPLGMPYRRQTAYAMSVDDLLGMLENLVVSMANPRKRAMRLSAEPVPDIRDHLITLEAVIGKYQEIILQKIGRGARGHLRDVVEDLDATDSIRCFFAVLFLARDGEVSLEQDGEEIVITVPPA